MMLPWMAGAVSCIGELSGKNWDARECGLLYSMTKSYSKLPIQSLNKNINAKDLLKFYMYSNNKYENFFFVHHLLKDNLLRL